MKKAVIFDLDGTLLYTLEDLRDAMNYTLREFNMPERSLEEVRSFVGNGIKNLIRRAAAPGTTEEVIEQMFECYKPYYDEHCLDKTGTYDGIPELLEVLYNKGYSLAIVSNKVDSAVKELNERFFSKYVKVAIGEKPGIRRKPAPDTVETALSELGISAEDAVYVGDSDVDVATAANSGLPCISVLWGFRDKEFLVEHGGKIFVDTPEEVVSIVDAM
ncbi:MAG: HAD family hydrolase [Eubacterium sp.]|nr:HAD family hydrolase [Eubacterium sp.]